MATFGGSGILLQLQNIFVKRLPQRCQEIDDVIRKTSIKELKNCLPYIVESIFGYGGEPGWDLDKISKQYNPYEFQAVRRFLAPGSPFLNLIYNLQADIYLQYEFQLNHLPAPTRHLMEEGAIPMFYVNKLRQDGFGQTYLALGAFEYYIFHFAYYVVNPNLQQSFVSWNNFYDFLYPNLVDDYIHYFLPLDKKTLPAMPHMPAPVRSPVAQYSIPNCLPSGRTSPSPQHHRTRPSLFKTSFTAMQKQHVQGSPVLEQGEAETWRSETLLQIFAEFWLNQNSPDMGRLAGYTQTSLFSQRYMYERDPFYYLFDHFMPTQNQAKIVRCLIKYLHYFTNSASNVITSPYHHTVPSPLDVFKRTTVPQIIQKKLYAFLRHAFDKWPLDSSFKWVLEAWLSYIQPWRYVDPSQLLLGKEHDVYTIQERRVDDKWDQFVEDNLLFYTVLFQRFLPRIYRFDLTSYQSANMLFRVTKVMNLTNLAGLIFKAERELCGSSFHPSHLHMSHDIGNSYLSGMPQITASLPPQLVDFEQPSFQYQPMFGEVMSRTIQDLIQQIMQAYQTVQTSQMMTKPKGSGFFSWLSAVFAESNPFASVSALEKKKTVQHLQMSMKNLADIFKLPLPTQLADMTIPLDASAQMSYLPEPETPDCIETEHGPELTDLGKYQVINGLRKFDISYSGDPDLQPVRSFENATLVRILHRFCSFVNIQFGEKIKELYSREDIVGRLAKVYFSPPISPCQKINSPISKTTAKVLRQPRLSLRFLASYSTLVYLTLLFLFLWFWIGLGPIGFVFLLVVLLFMYGAIAASVGTNHVKEY